MSGVLGRAIYPGSFDPITNGHLDILDRTLNLFGEVILLVADARHKNALFTPDERVALIREVCADRPGVKVEQWSGLLVDFAKRNHVSAIIRGLRATSDFEYEFLMASVNKQLSAEAETLFMMTNKDLFFVSSSMVKEVAFLGGDISSYVPPLVEERIKNKRQTRIQGF
jgi:pantetheine-phosphate adenylyltransferase